MAGDKGGTVLALKNRIWLRQGPSPLFQDVGTLTAVFDPATGETHLLAELPALVLGVMNTDAASASELIERLAGPVELESDANAQISTTLGFLESAELVESRPVLAE